jgi:hypothetical protein
MGATTRPKAAASDGPKAPHEPVISGLLSSNRCKPSSTSSYAVCPRGGNVALSDESVESSSPLFSLVRMSRCR